jgi:hypothetical protein
MSKILNNTQFAEHIKEHGGGTIGFFSRALPPENQRGFATSVGGAEVTTPDIDADQLTAYQKQFSEKAAGVEGSMHGAWKTPGGITQDVSVVTETPNKAKALGIPIGEEASYALPHTPVNRKGAKVGKNGGDVLLHTADLGENDVDPNYRPGALDMKGGRGSFTKNQYANKDWNKVAGEHKGEKVTYGDVLKKINKNRAERIRNQAN